jgi:hypothetical protein
MGKNGGIHININQDLRMTPIGKGNGSSGIKDINVPREQARARPHPGVNNPRTKEEAGRPRPRETDGDRRDLSIWYKPKVKGAAQTGTVPFRVSSSFRHKTGLGPRNTGTKVHKREASSSGDLTGK